MVFSRMDDLLFLDDSTRDILDQSEGNSTTTPSFDKSVLWPGIEAIFTINELRMQHGIALLRSGTYQVGQPLPFFEVSGANNPALGDSSRLLKVIRRRIALFGAEYSIHPTIFMLCQTHIVYIHVGLG